MLSFLLLNMVHVIQAIYTFKSYEEEKAKGDLSLYPDDTYLFYIGFEILASAIFVMAKITEDLFIQFNRNRAILKVSIF